MVLRFKLTASLIICKVRRFCLEVTLIYCYPFSRLSVNRVDFCLSIIKKNPLVASLFDSRAFIYAKETMPLLA